MFRTERKFLFNNKIEAYLALQSLLKKYSFRKKFKTRNIYSVYLDTKNLDYLFENIIGLSNRKKIRYRFYSDNLHQLIHEEKIKKNNFGTKIKKVHNTSYKLDFASVGKMIESLNYKNNHKTQLYQQINVSYRRDYYVDIYKNSLTVDSDINFFNKSTNRYERSVIEYKITKDNYENNYFHKINYPFTRHSKYVVGMAIINQTMYV